MKKFLSIFFIVTFFLNIFSLNYVDANVSIEGDYEYVVNSDGVQIIKYNGTNEDVIIPKVLGNKDVTSIGFFAFYGCRSVKSIVIEDNILEIEDRAFEYCLNLRKISIGENVNEIKTSFFNECYGLEEICVSENNKSYSSLDGVLFNKEQTELLLYPQNKLDTNYTIMDTVKRIGEYAFCNACNLKGIDKGDYLTSIGKSAFEGCKKLENIYFGKSLTSIEKYAFLSCKNLTSVNLQHNITFIDKESFSWCKNLKTVIIDADINVLKNLTFNDCVNLTSVVIGEKVKSVEEYAFDNDKKIKTFVFKNKKCKIGKLFGIPNKTIVIGYRNSYAYKFAKKYYKQFREIGDRYIDLSMDIKNNRISFKQRKIIGKSTIKSTIKLMYKTKCIKKTKANSKGMFKIKNVNLSKYKGKDMYIVAQKKNYDSSSIQFFRVK